MKRWPIRIMLSCSLILLASAFAYVYSIAWFLLPGGESEIIDGKVGIRNYFYAGNGTAGSPFEITDPIHLYNLSKLQNLGVFSDGYYEFRIGTLVDVGTEGNHNYQYRCISGYDGSGNPIYANHLDMSSFSELIEPIGNERTPFYGHFNGNGLPICGLTVTGKPEDIGLFGYVSYEGLVENVLLDTVTIKSLGYSRTSSDPDYQTFYGSVDTLFEAGGHYFKTADLKFVNNNTSSSNNLKSTTVFEVPGVNAGMTGEYPNYIFNGHFELVAPTYTGAGDDPFTYSLRCSTPLLQTYGDDDEYASMNLQALAENDDFNGTDDHLSASCRISIVASIKENDIEYSRVIQSYICKFQANPAGVWTAGTNDWAAGNVKLSITCAYIEDPEGPYPFVNYHHGNNIGFLAGHMDGSMRNCYVYNGEFQLNDSGYNPVYTESQSGLVGEMGSDVTNGIDPSDSADKGERGVLDITGIYKSIRDNFRKDDKVRAGKTSDASNAPKIISYSSKMGGKPAAALYTKYLRYDDFESAGGRQYITSGGDLGNGLTKLYESAANYKIPTYNKVGINSVDFLWNQVVEEGSVVINGETVERGLGVFKIVSSYQATTSPYGEYMTAGLGKSTIYNLFDEDRITDVFFSTAEIDWDKTSGPNPWSDGISPLKMATLPTYSDLGTFKYPFSRDFNYVFKLDLNDGQNIDENRHYYMFNNDSAFLTNYLSTVLIDEEGKPVLKSSASGVNEEFGFYFRERGDTALHYLQSYIVVDKPGTKQPYVLESGLTRYYPPNSIVFHIDNANGANVSVIGNRADISIYSFDSINSAGNTTERYTMRAKNTGEENMHRYFTYNRSSGAVERENTPIAGMKDNDVAFAHIFKLTRPGDYVIGASSDSNTTARIFYLAVQGQDLADLGKKSAYISGNGIVNVDFLLDPPLSESDYADPTVSVNFESLGKAQISFQAFFNNSAGTGTVVVESFIDTMNTVDESDDKKCIRISFNDESDFTSYLLANSKSLNPFFHLKSGEEDKPFVSALGKYPFD